MIINDFHISIRKTKIVDIDKDVHNLPPDFGAFPEYKVADYNCPEDWSRDGYFIPVKEGQPLWIDLRGNDECACIMSVQRLNPITGKSANLKEGLQKDPEQNYMVLPDQKWIDGYVNEGKVYQFMITKAGEGLAVNEYLLPEDMQDSHAIGLAFFGLRNPKPKIVDNWRTGSISISNTTGRFTQNRVADNYDVATADVTSYTPETKSALSKDSVEIFTVNTVDTEDILDTPENLDKASMAAGGRIDQEIVTDRNTVEYYTKEPSATIPIYLALPEQFASIMRKDKQQDASKPDKYLHSGKIGNVQVPLVAG